MTEETGEVIIFKLFGEKEGQGSEVARIAVSTYKWAPRNAIRQWVLDTHPEAGRYAAVFPEGYNHGNGRRAVMNIYQVSYPDAIVNTNGDDEAIGHREPWKEPLTDGEG